MKKQVKEANRGLRSAQVRSSIPGDGLRTNGGVGWRSGPLRVASDSAFVGDSVNNCAGRIDESNGVGGAILEQVGGWGDLLCEGRLRRG